ncbi:MAG: hypothetical protein J6X60_03555 [Ruminiclostridium sp.]|nr:hypothetical protein [Ruminiclostridium sp.]
MNTILFSICAAALIAAIYKAVAPSDKFGDQIKMLTACFFTVTVIGAVTGTAAEWDISDIISFDAAYNDYSRDTERLMAEETAKRLRERISEKLAGEKISPEKIYIDINIPDGRSISINEIKLVFRQGDYDSKSERAVVLVKQLVGTRIKVTAEISSQTKKDVITGEGGDRSQRDQGASQD